MTNHSATRLVAVVLLVAGLALSPLLNDDEPADSADAGTPASAPQIPSARFVVNWQQGHLSLVGHTFSATHEQDLLELASNSFPGATIKHDFKPLSILPTNWQETTGRIVSLLAETVSANASLSRNQLIVRSVTTDEPRWQSRFDALAGTLPTEVRVSEDSLFVDSKLDTRNACSRSFESFDPGAINFEESSAEFRSSAFPRLDRVIALAQACAESRIAVTGHTDASGSKSGNQRLSVARADAVADYIVAGGVTSERLTIAGIGSAEPIADDNTRYGRSLNRRIEITFSNN